MTVRGVGESHEAVKQTDSGFGVDAQAGPEGHPLISGFPKKKKNVRLSAYRAKC